MPEVQITVTADELETEDDLWDLFKDLNGQGWRGTLSVGTLPSDPNGAMGWRLQAFIDSETLGGVPKSIEAHIGDMKVVIGGVINVMTTDAYNTAYGGAA